MAQRPATTKAAESPADSAACPQARLPTVIAPGAGNGHAAVSNAINEIGCLVLVSVAGLSVQGVGFAGFIDHKGVGAAHLDTDAAGAEHELDNPARTQNLSRSAHLAPGRAARRW
jgi:hypothetical protein